MYFFKKSFDGKRRMPNITRSVAILWTVLCISASAADESTNYQIETITDKLSFPYGIVFLPGGDMLVTEKPGRLRVFKEGVLLPEPISGVPEVFRGLKGDQQQGGLLDIALHPQFAENRLVYLSMSEGNDKASTTGVIRGEYRNGRLEDVVKIYTATPSVKKAIGYGARMIFLPDGTLLMTMGDRLLAREEAQNLGSSLGKVLRVKDDGGIPGDNPFINNPDALPEIWSYGHRIIIGIVYDPVSNTVYAHENGPKGGDELNILKAGNNYGWPFATYGLDYSGGYVSPFTSYPGTEQPLTHWTPSLAPSGLTICRGCQWSEWEGDLIVGNLIGQQVRRIRLRDGVVIEQETLFEELEERFRDVRFGPDGALYILTDNERGRVLRVVPKR
jgi:glucose/arabinose dehydrogenase